MLSTQAIIVAIVYFTLLIIGFIGAIVTKQMSIWSVVGFLISTCLGLLVIYDTNCLTQGGCSIWSTIRTILYVFMPIIILIMFFYTLFRKGPSAAFQSQSTYMSTSPMPLNMSTSPMPLNINQESHN